MGGYHKWRHKSGSKLYTIGGINPEANYTLYWNDCSAIYSALKSYYGYTDNNCTPVCNTIRSVS